MQLWKVIQCLEVGEGLLEGNDALRETQLPDAAPSSQKAHQHFAPKTCN